MSAAIARIESAGVVDFRQVNEFISPFKRPLYQKVVLEFGHLAG